MGSFTEKENLMPKCCSDEEENDEKSLKITHSP